MDGNHGVCAATLRNLFGQLDVGMQQKTLFTRVVVRLSYFEVFEECIRDLLNPETDDVGDPVHVVDTVDGFELENCSCVNIDNYQQGMKFLEEAQPRRYQNNPNLSRKTLTALKLDVVRLLTGGKKNISTASLLLVASRVAKRREVQGRISKCNFVPSGIRRNM